ncbi:MAG: glutamine synthetase III [Lachnospiraceae bacterium]|nr:glutamine synthetase III [Lachnospiraceae bacterium]
MGEKLTEIFGTDVFNESVMEERLPAETFQALKETIHLGKSLDSKVAEVIAQEMKNWALEHGATHYTHWFQPLTGITAEKHDSFITPSQKGKILLEFSSKELIKGEPDASSFPSGGLRATFEARGYTTWDCTSPAFLREDAAGVTLCIPTAFCSYTGEALDMKTPLLRSMEAINRQALRIVHLFGYKDVTRVDCSVGPEQEYFLVDQKDYRKREDLIFTGRTLFGAKPPKGQEMDDHYFGSLTERVGSYMKELNLELWKLGILAKTQHNEAAPAQHELAPIYTTANMATDHNQLIMECMKKVAKRHGLECLLHEKPFAGVNGSGKHNNWSLVTDTGKNLLNPGKTPNENIQFLLFLAAVMEAVDNHADLLRLSAANPGNDHRLGADEAPPAIISVFLGEQLTDVVAQLIETGEARHLKKGGKLHTGVSTLPTFGRDGTDRNRTSPFAFTGNKFEFRTVASSMSIADANTTINTIVAETLERFADILEAAEDFDQAVHDLIKSSLTEHQRIIFNGNGYSAEWVEEAERRGLPNLPSMVDAIPALTTEKAIRLFGHQGVFSETELRSRAEIDYEIYAKAINIEARTMIDMAGTLYIPAIIRYTKELAASINGVKSACETADVSVQTKLLIKTSALLTEAQKALDDLRKLDAKANGKTAGKEMALFFRRQVCPAMEALRKPIDELELIVDRRLWPVPTYAELLYDM